MLATHITLLIKLLVVVDVLAVGSLTSFDVQQVNADNNNGSDLKSCNDHQSGDRNCSHKDSTPFILPFP
jgi:hypothetical protein